MTNPITQWNRMSTANSVERLVADRAEKSEKSDKAEASHTAQAPAAAAGDQLQLSAVARQVSNEPEFDRAKVEAIKHAVQNGQYPLDPRRMAESFMALEQMIRD